MKITLITVCYNSEKTIKDTIESVLKQTYKKYEYIIVDGNSKDKTLDIIKSYEKKFNNNLEYISESDKGLYDAMNKGIKLASGDVIGILNSDDILYDENVFQKIIDNFEENDGVYSNLVLMNEDFTKITRNFKSKELSKKKGWHPPHPTLYLKKEIYEKYGNYNINYKIAADLDFMYRIINNNVKLKYIDTCFVKMRTGGASTNGLKGYYKNFKESYKVLKNNKRKLPLLTNIYRIYDNLIKQKIMK